MVSSPALDLLCTVGGLSCTVMSTSISLLKREWKCELRIHALSLSHLASIPFLYLKFFGIYSLYGASRTPPSA